MVKLHIFKPEDLPENLKWQILDFARMEWPEGYLGKNRLRTWITRPEFHPISMLLEEEGILISHLEIVWKYLSHKGETYKCYGLTGVLTYPQFRKQGYGLQLLNEAKKYIEEKGDGDIVMFHSTVKGFYEKVGFSRMEDMITLIGDEKSPKKSPETAFMLFLSEKGKQNRQSFEKGPVYFGENTW